MASAVDEPFIHFPFDFHWSSFLPSTYRQICRREIFWRYSPFGPHHLWVDCMGLMMGPPVFVVESFSHNMMYIHLLLSWSAYIESFCWSVLFLFLPVSSSSRRFYSFIYLFVKSLISSSYSTFIRLPHLRRRPSSFLHHCLILIIYFHFARCCLASFYDSFLLFSFYFFIFIYIYVCVYIFILYPKEKLYMVCIYVCAHI